MPPIPGIPMPPIPPIGSPPGPPGAAASGYGMSAIATSVVRSIAAIDTES